MQEPQRSSRNRDWPRSLQRDSKLLKPEGQLWNLPDRKINKAPFWRQEEPQLQKCRKWEIYWQKVPGFDSLGVSTQSCYLPFEMLYGTLSLLFLKVLGLLQILCYPWCSLILGYLRWYYALVVGWLHWAPSVSEGVLVGIRTGTGK